MRMRNVIGLFGTCDGSQWRVPVIQKLDALDIEWYNPDAGDNWEPWMADEENMHLREDHIIVFPVLGESLGLGSLGEIGFSVQDVARAVTKGADQTLIVVIEDICTDERKTPEERKTSDRTRKLVKSKLQNVTHTNVYLVDTVEDAINLAFKMHGVYAQKDEINEVYRPSMTVA